MARKLTDILIRRLPAPSKGNKIHYEGGDVAGFGIRVTTGGAAAFILNYRTRGGRERRITIGRHPIWSATAARAEAKRLRHLIDQGGDPLADLEARREAPTVAALIDRFEAEHLPRKRDSTAADYRRMLQNHIRPHFGAHMKVQDVAFADIDSLHRKITATGHHYRANAVVRVLSKMFSLAVFWGMRDTNPCKGIERNTEYVRRRYLSGDELVRLINALTEHPDKQAADIIRILLLTGCRRGEALSIRWADLDLTSGTWSKPASSTKQKEAHEVPLSAPARQLLSEIREEQVSNHRSLGSYVFPSHGAAGHRVELKRDWRQITTAAGIVTNLRLHDLRHSFASQLASGGASLPLIGSLLGHANPATTARYAHLFADPQRVATERVGAIITAAGRSAGVPTPIKQER